MTAILIKFHKDFISEIDALAKESERSRLAMVRYLIKLGLSAYNSPFTKA